MLVDGKPLAGDRTPHATEIAESVLLLAPEVREAKPGHVLFYGSDARLLSERLPCPGDVRVHQFDPAAGPADPPPVDRAELVVCSGLLERTPVDDLDFVLSEISAISDRVLFRVATAPSEERLPDGRPVRCTVRYADWWVPMLRQFFDHVERVHVAPAETILKTWRSHSLLQPLKKLRAIRAAGRLRIDRPAPPDVAPHGDHAGGTRCLTCESDDCRYLGDKNGYHVWRCLQCRLVFVDPMPTDDELEEFYSSHPRNDKYIRKADGKFRRARWRIIRLKPRVKGRRFLDIGCSVGSAVEAARMQGFQGTGIDLDPQCVRMAAEKYPQNRFLHRSVDELADAGEQFDLIFCTEVIEHVPDPAAFIDDVRRLLSPDGILFMTTPHGTHFRLPRDILTWYGLKPPEHIVLFGRGAMRALLERRGMRMVSAPLRLKTTLNVVARRAA